MGPRRSWAAAVGLAAALALASCGSSAGPRASTTTGHPVTSTTAPPTTTAGASVYFLHSGTVDQPGPFLVPVWKAGAGTPRLALAALLAGPPSLAQSELASPAVSTGVPSGTRMLGLAVASGTATVDLSGNYAAGGGSTAMLTRLAQVVYTATQFPGVDRVAFRLDGRPVTTFSAEGIEIGTGIGRDFFAGAGLLPRILVEHPAIGEPVSSPFWISGVAKDAPGSSFAYELTRGGEDRLTQGSVSTGTDAGWSTFRQRISYSVPSRQRVDLVVYLGTATAPVAPLTVPFYLGPPPAGAAATCSASGLDPAVTPEAGLPAVVAAMRADIAAAAVRCDYAGLVALGNRNGAGLRVTWGAPVDPAALWAEAEAGGHGPAPMWYLRTLLGLPYGLNRDVPAGREVYTWPAAAAGPGSPTEAQLEEVAAAGLYTLDELHQQLRATGGGYTGYRVFISVSGDWQGFVSGD